MIHEVLRIGSEGRGWSGEFGVAKSRRKFRTFSPLATSKLPRLVPGARDQSLNAQRSRLSSALRICAVGRARADEFGEKCLRKDVKKKNFLISWFREGDQAYTEERRALLRKRWYSKGNRNFFPILSSIFGNFKNTARFSQKSLHHRFQKIPCEHQPMRSQFFQFDFGECKGFAVGRVHNFSE